MCYHYLIRMVMAGFTVNLNVAGNDYTVSSSQNGGDFADYTLCLDASECYDVTYSR